MCVCHVRRACDANCKDMQQDTNTVMLNLYSSNTSCHTLARCIGLRRSNASRQMSTRHEFRMSSRHDSNTRMYNGNATSIPSAAIGTARSRIHHTCDDVHDAMEDAQYKTIQNNSHGTYRFTLPLLFVFKKKTYNA